MSGARKRVKLPSWVVDGYPGASLLEEDAIDGTSTSLEKSPRGEIRKALGNSFKGNRVVDRIFNRNGDVDRQCAVMNGLVTLCL